MIVFLDYQYKGIGGVGQLVANLTCGLNKYGFKSKIYCSYNSYEYKRLIALNADFEWINSDIVSKKNLINYITKDDVILLTHIFNGKILEELKTINCRILFFSLHPDTFFCYPSYLDRYIQVNKQALDFIDVLLRNEGLIFMDIPNVEGVKRRGFVFNSTIHYLRVPVYEEINKRRTRLVNKSDCFHVTYLGRGNDYWKVYPVIKVIQDLNCINELSSLSIITDKNEWYQEFIKKYVPNNTVSIEFVNNLSGADLEKYLFFNSNLHIAMGTSALEGAKLGIPTLLIDYSKKRFPDTYLYKWLFETDGNSLGNDITNITKFEGHPLVDCIESVKKNFKMYSDLSANYIDNNHNLYKIVDQFLNYLNNTRLSVNDYCDTRYHITLVKKLPLITFVHKILDLPERIFRKIKSLFHV